MKPFAFVFILSLLMIAFNNCGKDEGFKAHSSRQVSNDSQSQNQTNQNETEDINALKNPKPEKVCGETGYEYLMDEYLYLNCVGCHANGGLVDPPLADKDISISHAAAVRVSKTTFLHSVSQNTLCGDCNLSPDGEVYKAIEEWLDNRFQPCDE